MSLLNFIFNWWWWWWWCSVSRRRCRSRQNPGICRIHKSTYVHRDTHTHMYIYICIYTCTYTYCTHTHTHILHCIAWHHIKPHHILYIVFFAYIYTCTYIFAYICIQYIYIWLYVYLHTFITIWYSTGQYLWPIPYFSAFLAQLRPCRRAGAESRRRKAAESSRGRGLAGSS